MTPRPYAILLRHCFLSLALWMVSCTSGLAEHETSLRGIINLPELKGALLEVNHTLLAPHRVTTTRLVKAGEKFEDQTIKGAHVQFEILEINTGAETIKLRENGKEMVYGLEKIDGASAPSVNASTGKTGFRFQMARFEDVLELYSDFKGRTVLLHPEITWSPISVQAMAQSKLEITDSLEKAFLEKGITTILDGEKFVWLVPTRIEATMKPHSKDLDPNSGEPNSVLLHGSLDQLVRIYGSLLGRTRSGNAWFAGPAIYLRTRELSKAEILYAIDMLLQWNGLKVVLIDDKTFDVVPSTREK